MLATLAAAALATGVAGCAGPEISTRPDARSKTVKLLNSDRSGKGDTFSWNTRACTAGQLQLVASEEIKRRRDAWMEGVADDESCVPAKKLATPKSTGYRSSHASKQRPGRTVVIVLVDEAGGINAAQAMRASRSGFGARAKTTIKTIQLTPASRSGKPVRSAFALPLDYAYH